MTKKHARLANAVNDAMLAQGFNMKQVAAFAGCTASNISNALSGKYDMREERWRLVCENLGLDYDEVIKEPEPELPPSSPRGEYTSLEREARPGPAEETGGGTPVLLSEDEQKPEEDLTLNEEERSTLAVAARYMASHLKEDIRKGMNISLEDLYTLMTFCKKMQEAAENGT